MKFIKNHFMFILPLIAILLGMEFYFVFDRTTDSYERGLKDGYSMLVVTEKPVSLEKLRQLNKHISSSEKIKRKHIVSEIAKGVSENSAQEILKSLPHFYTVQLDSYLETSELEEIKEDLEADNEIKSVETFGSSYSSSYRLFSFIKFSLKIFILFMGVVSLLLIIKQMEIWKFTHIQRMQVMEIFGAPLMLRSGVLFKVALIDALIATVITSIFFLYMKFVWAANSGIDIMVQNQDELFRLVDIFALLLMAICIVLIAVTTVVLTTKGVEE